VTTINNPRRTALSTHTLALVAVIFALFIFFTYCLTHGFRAWTTEDSRRYLATAGAITLSPVSLVDAGMTTFVPWKSINNHADPHVVLIAFIYTTCPAICKVLGTEFQQLQDAIAIEAIATQGIKLVSISFDQRDDQTALKKYADRYHADGHRWKIARAADAAAIDTLLDEAGVKVIADGMGGFAHNDAIHVVDQNGKLLAIFDYAEYLEALAYAKNTLRIMRQNTATNYHATR
jgi:protein SCO1